MFSINSQTNRNRITRVEFSSVNKIQAIINFYLLAIGKIRRLKNEGIVRLICVCVLGFTPAYLFIYGGKNVDDLSQFGIYTYPKQITVSRKDIYKKRMTLWETKYPTLKSDMVTHTETKKKLILKKVLIVNQIFVKACMNSWLRK